MEKELSESIGKAARAARKKLELTQEEAAERVGVSAEFYARIERGHALPSVQTMVKICAALAVSADDLIGRTDMGQPGGVARSWVLNQPQESPEVRRLVRRLRSASPATLRLVSLLVKELEARGRAAKAG